MRMRERWVLAVALQLLAARSVQADGACGDPATRIGAIQGSANATQLAGARVEVEAVVTADFRDGLGGFFLQDADGERDGDPATSDGLFVFSSVAIEVGQRVRLAGTVAEHGELTELERVSVIGACPGDRSASPARLRFPLGARDQLERYEGMRVELTQTLTVTGNYDLPRYGALELSASGRLFQPTQVVPPGVAAVSQQDLNDRQRIVLDDGSSALDPPPRYVDATGTRRTGDAVAGVSAILDQRFGDYRLQPTAAVAFAPGNPAPARPHVPGRLHVASANLHNYFTTLNDGAARCGPDGTLECRGARSSAELATQRAKLVAELSALDADVIGVLELENDASRSAADLIAGLNAALGTGTYAYVETGVIGSDAIKVALLYTPAKVSSVGEYELLCGGLTRPVLAQTFSELASGGRFTVVVNHWKSKSGCSDDPDRGDGQGGCNRARLAAAEGVAAWLAGAGPVLLIGDFNAYAMEDPLRSLEAADYRSLARRFDAQSYSFQYQAQFGSLDHALANEALLPSVRGFAVWHINADQPPSAANDITSGPARASDHDPLLVGLDLAAPLTCRAAAGRRP
jgi:predicted extracellular nuclease